MATQQPVLSVQNLTKIYPGKKSNYTAVDDISFDLAKGEILGLLGPNGAGKTTTIQMLISTLTPTSGKIIYFGKDLSTHRSEVLKSVVFASTYVSLPWNLTVRQNLEIFGRLYEIPKSVLSKRIDELLTRFGIRDKKEFLVSGLSAGQITRLMLVKAFMVKPQIVLLDEPTASLDPDIAKDVCQFVLEQRDKEGLSILFTSHNMSEVSEVCDRVLFLQKGKIIANDIPEILAKSVSICKVQLILNDEGITRTKKVVEYLNLLYAIERHKIEIEVEEHQIAKLLNAIALEGVLYSQINIIQPSLEDYFLHQVADIRKERQI